MYFIYDCYNILENLGFDLAEIKLLAETKRCLETWQRLVHIAGRELELSKSSFALMAWKLKRGNEVLASIRDDNTVNIRHTEVGPFGVKNVLYKL